MQLQTIYKFYKEVINIKSKTGINDCGRKCRVSTTIVLESTEADYCAHLSIEGEMLRVQHVFLSKSEFSSRVCLQSSTSPCNEISDCQQLCIRCYCDTTFADNLQLKSYRDKNSHIVQPVTVQEIPIPGGRQSHCF